MKKRIVLAGGSGFLGKSLAEYLIEKGYDVVILSRNKMLKSGSKIRYALWDGVHLGDWIKEINNSYAIVNFTGKSVDCIYTKSNKEEIVASRVDSVNVLRDAVNTCENPPEVFVQAGSLAIFGNTREVCNELSPHGKGFSVSVCEQWEAEFFKKTFKNTRQVLLRIGFALGKDGGALAPLKKLARLNLGGTVGSGKQYISWLHIDDLNAMFLEAIENVNYTGIYNATGPAPVTNKHFMKILRKTEGKRWSPPVPAPLVWLGAYAVMKTEPNLALTGRNCLPERLLEGGFVFNYTDLETALKDLN